MPKAVVLLIMAMPWTVACSLTTAHRCTGVRPEARAIAQTVRSELSPLAVAVAAEFRYVGSQRFLLRERVDVQQHLFVDVASSREVRGFVWVQFERFIAGVEGRYEYDPERIVRVGSYEFIGSVRQYSTPPDPGSDRSRAFAMLESNGFEMPAVMTRARLIHVSSDDDRAELMIVYAERAESVGVSSSEEADALIRRAVAAVRVSD
jgi:hypothetical protein